MFPLLYRTSFFRDANNFGFSVRCMCLHGFLWKKMNILAAITIHIVQLFTQFHYQMLHAFYTFSCAFFCSRPDFSFVRWCGSNFVLLLEVGIFTRPKECCTTVNNINCNLSVCVKPWLKYTSSGENFNIFILRSLFPAQLILTAEQKKR